jgi:RNA polymerase sigma factor (sigma-70 family)
MNSDPASVTQIPEPPVPPVPPGPGFLEGSTPDQPPSAARLIREHWPRLRSIAFRGVHDWDLAADLASEAIFRYLRAKSRYPEGTLYGKILPHLMKDWFRKQKRHPMVDVETVPEHEAPADGSPDALALLMADETRERFECALRQLTPADADLLVRRFVMRDSTKQIAKALGISDGAVRMRISRAVNQLRIVLDVS